MACLLANIVVLILVVTAAVRFAGGQANRGWSEALRHAAIRFRGTWHAGNWLYEPAATFRHGEAHARLSAIKFQGERFLQLCIQQNYVTCQFEIYPQQKSLHPLQPEQMRRTTEFDWEAHGGHWRAVSPNGNDVRPLLTDGVRLALAQLLRLASAHSAGQLGVSLAPGWLVVRETRRNPSASEVEQFVECVCALADQIQLAIATDIEFVNSELPQLLEGQHCGVCGENLVSEIVVCRRCQTPHHKDCWEYGGGCATYACGSRECYSPRATDRQIV